MSEVDPYNPPQYGPLAPHVVRMSNECRDLVLRFRNLAAFVETKTFRELEPYKQQLLLEQKGQMEAYAKTLSLRYFMELLDRKPVAKD